MDNKSEYPRTINYTQMVRLIQLQEQFSVRVLNALEKKQSQGPTRVSGMVQEVDLAMKEAIKQWAKELDSYPEMG